MQKSISATIGEKPSKCNCAKWLKKYGTIVNDELAMPYVCPKCKAIRYLTPNKIDWQKNIK